MQHQTFDMNDPATELARAKIIWRTRALLKRRHELAKRAVEAVGSFSAMLVSVGTKFHCSADQQQILHDYLFQVFAEYMCFPDPMLGKFSSHEELFNLIFEGLRDELRRIEQGDLKLRLENPWSVRLYVRTAWSFEFGRVGIRTKIGHYSLESAHRTVFHFLNRYCVEYYGVHLQRTANGTDDDALRIRFAELWCSDAIHAELREVSDALNAEFEMLIARFNLASDEESGASPRLVLDEDAFVSPRRLAELFDVPLEPLRSRLKRWRCANLNAGWMEASNRKRGETGIVYRLGSVQPLIEELVAATSQRPAQ